jgi:hypothetical protein
VRAELLKEDVGGYLKENVGYEEDDQGIVVLEACEAEIGLEAVNGCVGDVYAVCR